MSISTRSRDDLAPDSREALSSRGSRLGVSSRNAKKGNENYLKTFPLGIDPEVLANSDIKGSLADPTLPKEQEAILIASRIDHFSRQPDENPEPAPFVVIQGSKLLQIEADSSQDYESSSSASVALRNDGVSNVILPGQGGEDISKESVGAIEFAAKEHSLRQASFSPAPAPSQEALDSAAERQASLSSDSFLGISLSGRKPLLDNDDIDAPPIPKGKIREFRGKLGIGDTSPIHPRMAKTSL